MKKFVVGGFWQVAKGTVGLLRADAKTRMGDLHRKCKFIFFGEGEAASADTALMGAAQEIVRCAASNQTQGVVVRVHTFDGGNSYQWVMYDEEFDK